MPFDFEAEVSRCVDEGFKAMCVEPGPFYLYYSTGRLDLLPDYATPTDKHLGCPVPFRGFETRERMRARVWEAARRLPFLPVEGTVSP